MALATFGVQKLRGKSTKRSFRDALMIGGLGQLGGMAGVPGMQVLQRLDQEQLQISSLGQTGAIRGLESLFPQFASQAPAAANVAPIR
jgi:hypothetical protein